MAGDVALSQLLTILLAVIVSAFALTNVSPNVQVSFRGLIYFVIIFLGLFR